MAFLKKRDEFIDLTALQKRGIPIQKENVQEIQAESSYVDLAPENLSPQSPPISANPFDFLDTLASSSQTQSGEPKPLTLSPPQPNTQDLKIQIENFEYKLDRLTEKLTTIESKLKLFEEKVK